MRRDVSTHVRTACETYIDFAPSQIQEQINSVTSEWDELQKANGRLVHQVAKLENKGGTTCDSRDQSEK